MDAGVAPRHAAIMLHEHEIVVRALESRVALDGLTIAAGDSAKLPDVKPLSLGSATIMIGEASELEARAQEPDSFIEAAGGGEEIDDQTAGVESHRPAEPQHAARNRVFAKVIGGCVLAAVFAIAAVSVSSRINAKTKTPEQRVAAILEDLNLADAIAVSSADGDVLALKGTVPDEAAQSKLVQRLNSEGLAPVLRLSIGERLAAAVKDVFRVNGLDVETEYNNPGVVLVRGLRGAAKNYDKIVDHAMKDVNGLSAVQIISGGPQKGSLILADARGSNFDSAAKRVVSVVDSAPAYIVTADGARYFVGSLLPQGHRVLEIDGTSVTLERDGEKLVMTF
jgi:type III secretion protein D